MTGLDGIEAIEKFVVDDLTNNFERNINEFSPHGCEILPGPTNWIVDSFFGQLYTGLSLKSKAIYGATEEIPDNPFYKLSNAGFLRVPFRKIPRIIVRARDDLCALIAIIRRSILSEQELLFRDQEMLFRGQHTEHTLNRSDETSMFLYGNIGEREPSLLASAVRAGIDFDEFMTIWSYLLKIFCATYIDELADAESSSTHHIIRAYEQFQHSYTQELFSLALAQHYGFPSVGLDLTTNLDTALFFAFNRIVRSDNQSAYVSYERTITRSELPVLYVLTPQKRFQLDYFTLKPTNFPTTRPDAQHARFMHTGWGRNRNYAAKRIVAAFYLDLPESEILDLPLPSDLFPMLENDRFAQFLFYARENIPTRFLEPFYVLG